MILANSDWVSALKKPSSATTPGAEPQSLHAPGTAEYFRLNNKWIELSKKAFLNLNVMLLMNGSYMMRVTQGDKKTYFCGNDDVWNKLEGKNRFWMHDIIDELWTYTVKCGMHPNKFKKLQFGNAIHLAKIEKVIGGEFK